MKRQRRPYGYEIKIARSFSDLDAWAAHYDEFVQSIGTYAPFYSRGWLRGIWPAFSLQRTELYFITVWKDGQIVALAPLQIFFKGLSQGWRKLLAFIGTHHRTLMNPWPDILIRPEANLSHCAQTILYHLESSEDWDETDLKYWPDESVTQASFRELCTPASFEPYFNLAGSVDLSEGYEVYQNFLGSKARRDLRRRHRRLEATSKVEFIETDHLPESRWEALKEMHLLRQARLNERGEGRYSIFSNHIESEALRAALLWAEDDGYARHYWLDIDDQPAAFALGLHFQDAYFYYFTGMDDRVEPYSGGKLLLTHIIETEYHRGTRIIDMMLGMSSNKARFANKQVSVNRAIYENRILSSKLRNRWVTIMKKITGREEIAAIPQPDRPSSRISSKSTQA